MIAFFLLIFRLDAKKKSVHDPLSTELLKSTVEEFSYNPKTDKKYYIVNGVKTSKKSTCRGCHKGPNSDQDTIAGGVWCRLLLKPTCEQFHLLGISREERGREKRNSERSVLTGDWGESER